MKSRDERERAYLSRTRGGWGRARQGVFVPKLGQRIGLKDDGGDAGAAMLRRRRCVVVRVNPLSRDRRRSVAHQAKQLGVGLAWQDDTTVRVFGPSWQSLRDFVVWASFAPPDKPETRLSLQGEISRCRSGERKGELLSRLARLECDLRPVLADWWFATNDANKAGGTMGKLAPKPRVKGKDDPHVPNAWHEYLAAERAAMESAREWVSTLPDLPEEARHVLRQCALRWFEERPPRPDGADARAVWRADHWPANVEELAEWADANVEWED